MNEINLVIQEKYKGLTVVHGRGKDEGHTNIIKQNENVPLKLPQEITILFALANGHLDDVEISEVGSFENKLLDFMESNHPDILKKIDADKEVKDESKVALTEAIKEFKTSVPY